MPVILRFANPGSFTGPYLFAPNDQGNICYTVILKLQLLFKQSPFTTS